MCVLREDDMSTKEDEEGSYEEKAPMCGEGFHSSSLAATWGTSGSGGR